VILVDTNVMYALADRRDKHHMRCADWLQRTSDSRHEGIRRAGSAAGLVSVRQLTGSRSIYRADDQVLVNTHIQGLAAAQAPVWHLHKLAGGELTSLYLDSFERVWESATPAEGT
jgi:predicted nucleic acid-binding protein